SSEIYGDPDESHIPTGEDYNGNVSCTGPRACYDESKRLGETMVVNYYKEYKVPIKSARPFNVYGPGLMLNDKRVIPDFFNDAIHKRKIQILSDGTPTRSFCYISDAVKGFMLVLLSEFDGEAFNIGNDRTEISMKGLAELIAGIVGNVAIEYKKSKEKDYLTDNPQRRCPDLSKAKSYLNYYPKVELEAGLGRLYHWYKQESNI
ncbi:MAG TPA: NAD-dependent epimerase/dehydratase family protein, partial [Bacillota bacterium]|nr:NAD-dependent epimerase/dehydratase family protein [Bacillota bacterium]